MIANQLHRVWLVLALVVLMGAVPWCAGAQAQTLEKLSVVIFSAPSLGAFMPPVIKAKKLDQANGLDIAFQERTPDAYTAQFNSGEFKVGGSASRSEEHTSELQSLRHLVCRLLLEKKKKKIRKTT